MPLSPTDVFINCPFDEDYAPIFNAILFTILDLGFVPRSALEEQNAGRGRYEKIVALISQSKFGIHDISRTQLDVNRLPRMNMPFELGLDLGAIAFGGLTEKKILVLEGRRYQSKQYLSDLGHVDPVAHDNRQDSAVASVRKFLADGSGSALPGEAAILRRLGQFQRGFLRQCRAAQLRPAELTYLDRVRLIRDWRVANAPA